MIIALLCFIVVAVIGGFFAVFHFSMVSTVMTKKSPDGTHRAKLTRVTGIDVNFRVYLDGDRIYGSPDFAPVRFDFREQIIWDTTGQLLILEVAGKRIFGYHAQQKRSLRDDELLAAELPPFHEYRYEGTLPKASFLNSTATPNHALQRTAPRVTLAAADHPATFAHPAPLCDRCGYRSELAERTEPLDAALVASGYGRTLKRALLVVGASGFADTATLRDFLASPEMANHALQRTAPRVTVAAISYPGVSRPSHLLL